MEGGELLVACSGFGGASARYDDNRCEQDDESPKAHNQTLKAKVVYQLAVHPTITGVPPDPTMSKNPSPN